MKSGNAISHQNKIHAYRYYRIAGKAFIALFLMGTLKAVYAQEGDDNIIISYTQPKKIPKHQSGYINPGIRYDLFTDDSTLVIRANQIRNLHDHIRRIVFYRLKGDPDFSSRPGFRRIGSTGRREIRKNMMEQYNTDAANRITWREMKSREFDTSRSAARDLRNFKRFLYGRPAGGNLINQWFVLARIPVDGSERVYYRARIRIPHKKDIFIYCDTVPDKSFARLPQVDKATCKPINRNFDFKKLNGFGYRNIRPLRYIPSKRKLLKKEFEIIFDRNSVNVDAGQLKPVIQFLEHNRYSILNASVQGYASVEGPEENNFRLQQKRAELMIRILQEHNEDEIELDTVIASENWDMFQEQVKNTPYSYLDSLGRDSVRILLKDTLLLKSLEPLLRKERKAILTLVLADIFSRDEINENFIYDIRGLSRYISTGSGERLNPINLNKVAGILAAVEDRIDKNLISKDAIAKSLEDIHDPVFQVMYFYTAIRKYVISGSKPAVFTWLQVFRNAQSGIIDILLNPYYSSLKNNYLKQAVDIQYYAFQFMIKGYLPWSLICDLDYPDKPEFYPLILNRYAFIFDHSQARGSAIPCNPDLSPTFGKQYSGPYSFSPRPLRPLEKIFPSASSVYEPGHWKEKPQYDASPKGAYYYFINKVFVNGDKNIRQYVIQSDNLYEFDLFDLIYRNVSQWNPITNYFYDHEIDMTVMFRLIENLRRIDNRICPMQKNQLYLDFSLKSLYYYKLYGNPFDRDQVTIIQSSLRFIAEYYMRHVRDVPQDLLLAVVKQMNFFYGLPGKTESTFWSYRILKEYGKNSFDSVEGDRLFRQMACFYEKNINSAMNRNTGTGPELCSFFRGKHYIKPFRKDVIELYLKNCVR